jgi:hypothetical protein
MGYGVHFRVCIAFLGPGASALLGVGLVRRNLFVGCHFDRPSFVSAGARIENPRGMETNGCPETIARILTLFPKWCH